MFRYTSLGGEPTYTRCYRCGELLGMSRRVMRAYQPNPVNLVRLGLDWLGTLREDLAAQWSGGWESYCQRCRKNSAWNEDLPFSERHAARDDALGAGDLPRLLAEAPFAFYGLKGNPLGLRLSDLDLSNRGHGQAILRYTTGEPDNPQRAMDIAQGAGHVQDSTEERIHAELRAVVGLVLGCAPVEQRRFYLDRRNVHRDWNLDRLSRAPRRVVTIQIDGKPTVVEVAPWQEPQEVSLARLALDDRPALVVSLGVSQVQLLGALKGLVSLRQDADALAEHERDYRTT